MGEEKFLLNLEAEYEKARARYPDAATQGLTYGAAFNWAWHDEKNGLSSS
jgi:hypothetical protein